MKIQGDDEMAIYFNHKLFMGAARTASSFGLKHVKCYLLGRDEAVRKELEKTLEVQKQMADELGAIRKILRDIEAKGDMTL